jgi:hypothetical protein
VPHAAHVSARNLAFQLGFKKFIRNQQRLHGFARVTAACRDGLISRRV